MYAIVDIAGQQIKVEKNDKVFVHRLEAKEGSSVSFDKVLLVDDNGSIQIGTPVVDNMIVTAKVLSHLKGDTVKVFKKKRRKGYQKLNGHRQFFSEIEITDIATGKVKKVVAEQETVGDTAEKTNEVVTPKAKAKEVKAEDNKEATAAKKPVAKKPAAKKTESEE